MGTDSLAPPARNAPAAFLARSRLQPRTVAGARARRAGGAEPRAEGWRRSVRAAKRCAGTIPETDALLLGLRPAQDEARRGGVVELRGSEFALCREDDRQLAPLELEDARRGLALAIAVVDVDVQPLLRTQLEDALLVPPLPLDHRPVPGDDEGRDVQLLAQVGPLFGQREDLPGALHLLQRSRGRERRLGVRAFRCGRPGQGDGQGDG